MLLRLTTDNYWEPYQALETPKLTTIRKTGRSAMCAVPSTGFGISAISIYEPPWLLGNDWFRGTIPRKFEQHTGTQVRPISLEDEFAMAVRATTNLQREVGCDLQKCAAVIFVSPSFVPVSVARKYLGQERAIGENVCARRD